MHGVWVKEYRRLRTKHGAGCLMILLALPFLAMQFVVVPPASAACDRLDREDCGPVQKCVHSLIDACEAVSGIDPLSKIVPEVQRQLNNARKTIGYGDEVNENDDSTAAAEGINESRNCIEREYQKCVDKCPVEPYSEPPWQCGSDHCIDTARVKCQ